MNFTIQLIRPGPTIRKFVHARWEEALIDLQKWMEKDLVRALVFGGLGIQGIAQTPFYRFITSPDGLSQLGIDKSDPPKLLRAYERDAFKVKRFKRVITLQFGNVARLKAATPHPATGRGQLKITSWLEWIIDKKTVRSRGFVPRKDLSKDAAANVRSSPGGLMLPRGVFGSTGFWKFPSQFVNYEDDWLRRNVKKIEQAILRQMMIFFQKRIDA
jgi:hypothetical protein